MPPKKPGAAGANQKKPLVVVAGATGHIGGEVVKDLAAHGYRVTALVRPGRPASMATAHRLESLGAHVVFADPTQADTLEGVADGAEAEGPAPRAVMGVEAVEETAQASLPQ